jgi:Holliday junction resolvase RusA-like endonuclease
MVKFIIYGEPCSKANSRQIVTINGRPAVIKSKKAREYERAALYQIPAEAKQMLEGELTMTLHIYYASERPDLDDSIILDVLQAKFETSGLRKICTRKGVYINDRQVRERHVFHHIDKLNPRAVIEVEQRVQGQLI